MKTAFSLAASTFAALLACAQPAEAQLLGGTVGGAMNGALGGHLGTGPRSLDGDITGSGALSGTGAFDSGLPDRTTATGRSVVDRSTRVADNTQQRTKALTGSAVDRTRDSVQATAGTGAKAFGNAQAAVNRLGTDAAAQTEGSGSLDLASSIPSPAVDDLPSLPASPVEAGTPAAPGHDSGASGDITPSMALSGRNIDVGADGRASGHAQDHASADIAASGSASAAR